MLVTHDGARFLPGLIQAMREQTQPVHRAVGVDTSSGDRSGAMLTELLGQGAVFGMEPDTGYGAAISRALQHPAARAPVPAQAGDQEPAVDWIWLLHDDCEPAPDALEQLLRAASRSKTTAVIGPKLRDLADRRVLREAGLTVDRAGRRVTGIEPGEIDQGQHDGNRAVVAVSSAGMLVRRDVWDQLGGFDANLPLGRDDVDFCWRAHAAGYDVRLATDAVMFHRELSARQIRKSPAAGGRPRMLDRRGALYVFAVNVPFGPMLVMMAGCVAGTLVRATYFLITKQQRKAWDQLGAVAWLARHPLKVWQARRRRAATRKHGYAVLRDQLPKGRTLAKLAESVAGLLSHGPAYEGSGLHSAITTDGSEDDLLLPNENSVIRRVLTNPGVLLWAGLVVVALVAERSVVGPVLTGSGTLSGGALVPAWGGASDLWHEYLAGYHATGVGSAASAPPYLAVVAALATLLGGKTWLATDVLLLGCVPAAGVTAYLAARRVTAAVPARVWIAGTYALLPVAMGAVAAGRIGTAVAFVLIPLIAIALGRILAGPSSTKPSRFTTRRAAWAAALLIAVAAAFVPLILAIAVVAALAALAAWRRLPPSAALSAVIVAVVPGVVLLPWTFHLFASPSAFLLEAGLARPGMAAGLRPGSLLLLSPGGPGLPPVWVTAGLVLPAFCALLLRRRTAVVYSGWAIALAGLVTALVVSRIRVTPPQGGPAVSAWPGVAIAIAAAGLLLAAVPVIEALWRAVRPSGDRTGPRWRSLALIAALAATVSAPLLAAGSWLAMGVRGPLTTAAPQVLPAFVAAASAGPDRPRTLVLRQEGGVLAYTVLRTSDPSLGEPELTQSVPATRALDAAVASLAAASGGDGGDPSQALSQFDIGYVLLPAPIDQTIAHELDAAAGLVSLTQAPAYDLWRVAGTVARVRIVTSTGAVIPVPSGSISAGAIVPAGMSGTLELAEAVGGWSATLGGRPLASLTRPVDGWAQGFALPAGGGSLIITRNETARDVSLGAEAVAVFVTLALALPGTRAVVQASVPAAVADADAKPAGSRRRRELAGRKRGRRPELPRAPLQARRRRSSGAREAAVAADAAPNLAPAASAPRPDLTPAMRSDLGSTGQPDLIPTTRFDPVPSDRPDLPVGRLDLPAEQLDPPSDWLDPEPDTRLDATPGIGPEVTPAAWPEVTPAARPDAAPSGRQDVVRRQRGGAHAARHGKPSRRWRPGPADRGPGTEASQVSQYSPAITKDRAAENGEVHDDAVPQDSGKSRRRPPWELGNRS